MWGKFLVQWWMARELRWGELHAWFRIMLRNTKRASKGAIHGGRDVSSLLYATPPQ